LNNFKIEIVPSKNDRILIKVKNVTKIVKNIKVIINFFIELLGNKINKKIFKISIKDKIEIFSVNMIKANPRINMIMDIRESICEFNHFFLVVLFKLELI
jgi:hypothetical protein